jgi:hypothetical protein
MKETESDWLVAVNGILVGKPGGSWARMGNYRFTINQILRETDGSLIAATGNGLWRVPVDRGAMWVQLNDETLIEVMAIAHSSSGILAGSPYGVAVSRKDEAGNPRWRSLTEHLRVNARFTNAILVDPNDQSRWLVATEGGVIIGEENGASWVESGLNDTPVRALIHAGDRFLAGTDREGLMQSSDGKTWERVGDRRTGVFAVDVVGDTIVAGSEEGVLVIERDGSHERVGPRALVRCLRADPKEKDIWLAGMDPRGLWSTHDAGKTWRNIGGASRVRDIVVPEGRIA